MASVLLAKNGARGGGCGGGGDQTELLAGVAKCNAGGGDADEAVSSFLNLEEGSEAGSRGGAGTGRGRGAGKPAGAACACRLAGERLIWLLLGLLAIVTATAVGLQLYRGHEVEALRRDVELLKECCGREAVDALRAELEQMKRFRGDDLQREVEELKHKVVELDLYTKLRQFEDEVYEMEEDDADDDDDEDDDEDEDLPANDDDDVDYYPDSDEEDKTVATPGPEHRGRFYSQYERLLGTHAPPGAPQGSAHAHTGHAVHMGHPAHAQRKKPGTEPVGAALAAAAAEAAAEAAQASQSLGARPKREIASAAASRASSVSGVPVLSGSYGENARRANGTEGLSLYEALVGGRAPPPAAGHAAPREKMLRSGWNPKRAGKEHRDTEAAATRRDLEGNGVAALGLAASATPTPNIISRQSHVMQTATQTPAKRRDYSAQRLASPPSSRLQWALAGRTTEVTPPPQGIRAFQDQRGSAMLRSGVIVSRPKKKILAKKTLRDGEEPLARQPHPVRRRPIFAAHYGGDASSYQLGHQHYQGNGRLRHPNKVFSDWMASEWVNQLNMNRKFSLNSGEVKVTDSGLYFIYAQIFYLDEKDTNGYRVEVNNKPVLQCIVTSGQTAGGTHELKANTCFTAGALYLASDDRVSIREVGDMRWTVFEPEKSFFGLIKLGPTAPIT